MSTPRPQMLVVPAMLFAFAFCSEAIVRAVMQQQAPAASPPIADQTTRGISQYQQGQSDEAITSLRLVVKRNKNDLRAWHYLGLALEKKGDTGAARKAHEKSAKLGDKLLDSRLDLVQREQDFARFLFPFTVQLTEAGESAQKYLTLSSKPSQSQIEDWSLRSDSLLGFAEIANSSPDTQTVLKASGVDTKARLISKPEPPYTEEARRNHVTGTVVLKVIFAATGRVIGIRVVQGLPDGLTGQAIRAARQIRFIPALKNGKLVSMYAQLEYTFTVY